MLHHWLKRPQGLILTPLLLALLFAVACGAAATAVLVEVTREVRGR